MKLGYDIYEVECDDIVELLNTLKNSSITLYRLEKIDTNRYQFYLPIYQRWSVRKYSFVCKKSIGVWHYLLLLVKSRLSIVGVISFAITVIISSNFIWDVQIIGNNLKTNESVNQVLNELNIDVGDRLRSYSELNDIYDKLKEAFQQDIDYLNIYQSGSVLMIEYTNSKGATKEELDFRSIYAKSDGVIKQIDVKSGNIVVKENQFVRKGELLVNNTITSTSDETKIIPVEGQIYAYTYRTIEASMDEAKMDEGEAFSYLLFQIRSKVTGIDKIDSEKVLEYDIIDSKRVLKVQYIFIEDIAEKGELNEATD